MEGKFHSCGKTGHKSLTCQPKNKTKAKWTINKAQSYVQTSKTEAIATDMSSTATTGSQTTQQLNAR
jgi:hypothetical protein